MRCTVQSKRCLGDCDIRPVRIEAVCWACWYEMYGKEQAIREWKREHWWRRLVP